MSLNFSLVEQSRLFRFFSVPQKGLNSLNLYGALILELFGCRSMDAINSLANTTVTEDS